MDDRAIWADPGGRKTSTQYGPEFMIYQSAIDHIRSHRSSISWPALAALVIEAADPHTSVTFIHLAQTGATVQNGILRQYRGAEDEICDYCFLPMAGQLDSLHYLLGSRANRIDILTLTAGGNDIGFRQIITSLIAKDNGTCIDNGPTEDDILRAFHTGEWGQLYVDLRSVNNFCGFLADLAISTFVSPLLSVPPSPPHTLPFSFDIPLDELNVQLAPLSFEDTPGYDLYYGEPNEIKPNISFERYWLPRLSTFINAIRPFQVYMMGYPDFSGGPLEYDLRTSTYNGPECITVLSGLEHGFEITYNEANFAREKMLFPLLETIQANATQNNWIYISDLPNGSDNVPGFNGHGLCKDGWAYSGNLYKDWGIGFLNWMPPSGARYFRRADEALDLQGSLESKIKNVRGTAHPNEFGHFTMARLFLEQVILPVDIPGIGKHDNDDQIQEILDADNFFDVLFTISDQLSFATDVDLVGIRFSVGEMAAMLSKGEVYRFHIVISNDSDDLFLRLFDKDGNGLDSGQSIDFLYDTETIMFDESDFYEFYVGVSGWANRLYSPITGTNDWNGLYVGDYQLEVRIENLDFVIPPGSEVEPVPDFPEDNPIPTGEFPTTPPIP